jgi:spectinomycin phosphotransferase
VGCGLFGGWRSPEDEESLFYRGYGPTAINPIALAYYRYERIVQDICAYCEEILLTEGDGEDRANGLRQLMSQFQPGAVIEMAYRTA